MAFGTASITAYIHTMESVTIAKLLDYWDTGSWGIAGGNCLYGRNAGTPGVLTYRDATIPESLTETYACTGYGSPAALYTMAKRHDGTHPNLKKKLANWTRHWLDTSKRNFEKHGIPPGEDTIHEPGCALNPNKRGDTDPWRHIDSFGHMQILCDSTLQALDEGGWSTEQAVGVARRYLDWVVNSAQRYFQGKSVREYLRYGNRLSILAGCYDVFSNYGYYTYATEALDVGAALAGVMYQPEWETLCTGTATDSLFYIFNYGDLEPNIPGQTSGYHIPFPDGWNRFLSQPWYDGHQVIGAYRLALRFAGASAGDSAVVNTGTYLTAATEVYNYAFQRLVHFVDVQTKWYSYKYRQYCPTGDYSSHGSADFVNAKLQGFKLNTATSVVIESEDDAALMTLAQWDDLAETTTYYRSHVVNYHESDGQYFQLLFTDTAGRTWPRKHKTNKYIQFALDGNVIAKWDTNSIGAWRPDLERAGNSYLIPDMVWIRGLMHNDADEQMFARILMFDYLAYANDDSHATRAKENRLPESTGWAPSANLMNFSRPWHWAMMCGHLIRDSLLGTTPPEPE